MTMTMPPAMPGTWRGVPDHLSEVEADNLRRLLDQDEGWVLRSDWFRYLSSGDDDRRYMAPIDHLTRDQRIAATAWLRQQRHRLHRALNDGETAPEGWLRQTPLYRALSVDDGRGDAAVGPAG